MVYEGSVHDDRGGDRRGRAEPGSPGDTPTGARRSASPLAGGWRTCDSGALERGRACVVGQMVRVAPRRVFVTGPFEENPFAREIDELLVRLEPDNRYLQEHARLGLPSIREIENWLSAKDLHYRVEPLTRCNAWLLALALTPFQQARPQEFREVTRYYNERFSELDRGHPPYQSLIEIEVDS